MRIQKFLVFSLLAVSFSVAQFDYPGCAALQPSHFQLTKLVGMPDGIWEPVKLAFDQDDQGNVNFFFIDLRDVARTTGSVKYYDVLTDQVSLVGQFPVAGGGNDGLAGLALDPNFKQNGWLYVQYSAPDKEVFRLSRFTIVNRQIKPGSEAVICEAPIRYSQFHTGGALQWDDYGDLWWSVGDNMAAEEGPSNTNDLRGKLNRIRPLPVAEGTTDWGPDKTYAIPAGNFGEYFAQVYPDRAAEFLDRSKVKPEVFAIGLRNGYTLTIDPVRRWATWGDCGPDHGMAHEEDNLITKPLNAGYPYWSGANLARPVNDYESMDPNAPINDNSKNTGLTLLPPATPSLVPYQQACAMTGPIYKYDPNNPSTVKMPPHFDKLWFTTEFNHDWIEAFNVADDGQSLTPLGKLTDSGNLFGNLKSSLFDPIDFQTGPDGAFYIINYAGWYNSSINTGIVKIEYIGPECDVGPNFVVEKAGCMNPGDPNFDPDATHSNPAACGVAASRPDSPSAAVGAWFRAGILTISDPGAHTIRISTLNGKNVASITGQSSARYTLDELNRAASVRGLHLISVSTQSGTKAMKVMLL